MDGEYSPGFHLKEEELCIQCNASRTPIRQAMRMLVDEGLVTVGSNRRCSVADVSEAHASEMYDVISMLESYSAGLAAKNATAEALEEIKALGAELEAVVEQDPDNMHAYMKLNSDFHKAVHRASGNKSLYELILRVVDFPLTLFLKLGKVTESDSALLEHREIIEAIENRDTEFAALLMKKHIERVRVEARTVWRDIEA